jgi:rhodanese-related sulfurtransferase
MDKRKIIQISFVSIVLISLAFGAIAQATAEETIVSVSPSTVEATHGDTFSIEIETDPAGAEIYGAQFDLYFDNNLLNATAQSQGTFLSQDGATTTVITNTVNSSIGKIEYGEAIMGAEHGVTEPGVLASITFDVVGTAGTCELKLSNVILSDLEAAVRGEAEYNAEHIADAEHIPLSELDGRIGELDADKKVIVYCQSGGRSRTASGKLVQQGHEQVYNMLGGISAWRLLYPTTLVKPAGTPTVAPSALISPSPGGASSAVVSPASTAPPSTIPVSTSTPLPEQKRDIPGFEAMSAIVMLLASYLILKQKGGKRE